MVWLYELIYVMECNFTGILEPPIAYIRSTKFSYTQMSCSKYFIVAQFEVNWILLTPGIMKEADITLSSCWILFSDDYMDISYCI